MLYHYFKALVKVRFTTLKGCLSSNVAFMWVGCDMFVPYRVNNPISSSVINLHLRLTIELYSSKLRDILNLYFPPPSSKCIKYIFFLNFTYTTERDTISYTNYKIFAWWFRQCCIFAKVLENSYRNSHL